MSTFKVTGLSSFLQISGHHHGTEQPNKCANLVVVTFKAANLSGDLQINNFASGHHHRPIFALFPMPPLGQNCIINIFGD